MTKLFRNISLFLLIAFIGSICLILFGSNDHTPQVSESQTSELISPTLSPPEKLRSEGPSPRSITALAKGLSVVPGAIICPDYRTASLLFDLYAHAWGEKMQDKFTQGQSKLIRGEPSPTPNPLDYDCILVPRGTRMSLEKGNTIPVVSVNIDGHWATGVTITGMAVPLQQQVDAYASSSTQDSPKLTADKLQNETISKYELDSHWLTSTDPVGSPPKEIIFSTMSLTINEHSFPLELVRALEGSEIAEMVDVFNYPIPNNIDGFLLKTSIPSDTLGNNSLCGLQRIHWVVALISDRNGEGQQALDLTFLSDDQIPRIEESSIRSSANLCGTYSYRKLP